MKETVYHADLAVAPEMHFMWMALHNELAMIKNGRIPKSHLDQKRIFLKTFTTMVEGVSFNLRQLLLKLNADDKIKVTLAEQVILSETAYRLKDNGLPEANLQFYDAVRMFKFTWKTFAKYHERTKVMEKHLGNSGFQCMLAVMKKRNRVTHPKAADDILISKEEWGQLRLAYDWFHEMTIAVFDGNLYRKEVRKKRIQIVRGSNQGA